MTTATKHVIVTQPGKLSPAQVAQIEADYERDVAANAAKPEEKTAATGKTEGEGEAEK